MSVATVKPRRTKRLDPLSEWFAAQGWKLARFQREVWQRYLAGESGLIHTPTGSGKTLAAFGGPLLEAMAATAGTAGPPARPRRDREGALRVLWVTPLRALALDTSRALRAPITALGLDWHVAMRTGDASSRDRRLAREGKAPVLVITPESLALLLSYPDTSPTFAQLRCIVVDEWHELLGNKRGVLLQLCLARIRAIAPHARTWGLSATLGNLEEARSVLLPHHPHAAIVSGAPPRAVKVETLIPPPEQRLPWGGHLGLVQLPRVLARVKDVRTSLLFTNTRAQAELWYSALSTVWHEDLATLALHHGSLDANLRTAAEQGLRDGTVRLVVATSSLDLGVDFPAVDQVLQVGSPKGVSRLLQRAGRAKHRPGESGHVICVPAHVLELVEYAAAREAIAGGRIEARVPPTLSLDVLAQHCVTLALGGGFEADAVYAEVRGTHAFAALDVTMWQAVLDFIVQGGQALAAYPEYHKVVRGDDGIYRVLDRKVALRHRLSIGTITGDGSVTVQLLRGARLGSVEENFIGRLRPGDKFHFAGRLLQLFRFDGMTAYVRKATGRSGTVPKWQGGRMPFSTELGLEVQRLLAGPRKHPELRAISHLLDLQAELSALPTASLLLAERVRARDGRHLFVYPFAGRAVNEGLAALLALRWGRLTPNSFSYAANDYGFALSPAAEAALDAATLRALLSTEHLLEDLTESLNLAEMARRQFREVARVSGLLPPSLPGRTPRSQRQLQASSGLIFDVLRRYDPAHLMLGQATREVFSAQLDVTRLQATLADCAQREIAFFEPPTFTPLSFPLWVESLRGQLSTESMKARIERAAEQLQQRYGR